MKNDRSAAYFVFFALPGVLLIIDLLFSGSGLWSEPLGFSVRKLTFASVCIYSLFYWLGSDAWKFSELAAVLSLAVFIFVWSFYVPLLGRGDIASAVSDSQLFLGLLFAPAIYSVVSREGDWNAIKGWIFNLTLVLSCVHVLFWLINFLVPDFFPELVLFVKQILEPSRDETETSVYIGYVGDSLRVFWGSSIFLLVGFYLSVKGFRRENLVGSSLKFLLLFLAILLTLTRGMVLSIPLFFVAAGFFRWAIKSIRNSALVYILYGVLLLGVTVPVVLLSDPSVLSSLGVGRDISDDLRSEQIFSLMRSFLNQFLVGGGFGISADVIRSESAPWSYEMSILALYMKIGIFGILFLLLVFVLFCLTGNFSLNSNEKVIDLSRIGAFGVIVTFCGNTNPYLFSMLGIGLILFFYFDFRCVSGQECSARQFS